MSPPAVHPGSLPPGCDGPPDEPEVPSYTLENIEYDVTVRVKGRLSDAAMDDLCRQAWAFANATGLVVTTSQQLNAMMEFRAHTKAIVADDLHATLEAAGFVETVEVVRPSEGEGPEEAGG